MIFARDSVHEHGAAVQCCGQHAHEAITGSGGIANLRWRGWPIVTLAAVCPLHAFAAQGADHDDAEHPVQRKRVAISAAQVRAKPHTLRLVHHQNIQAAQCLLRERRGRGQIVDRAHASRAGAQNQPCGAGRVRLHLRHERAARGEQRVFHLCVRGEDIGAECNDYLVATFRVGADAGAAGRRIRCGEAG